MAKNMLKQDKLMMKNPQTQSVKTIEKFDFMQALEKEYDQNKNIF